MSDTTAAATPLPPADARAALRVDYLLLTANPTEAAAANELLSLRYEGKAGQEPEALHYTWGYITPEGSHSPLAVALVWLSDDLGTVSAYAIGKKAVELLHPQYFIVLGIAAGVFTDDVQLHPGDIVYSRFVRSGPEGRNNTLREVPIHQPSASLISASETVVRLDSWRSGLDESKWKTALAASGLPETTQKPRVLTGEVVSKDGFVGPHDPFVSNCVATYPKLAAFDMETGGVGQLIRELAEKDRPPAYLFVKGISDIVFDKNGRAQLEQLSEREREQRNKEERERWKPFASHASAVFVRTLLSQSGSTRHRPAHPDMLWPPVARKSADVNTGCIGVYTSVEPEAYSTLAASLLDHVARDASDGVLPADNEHFFTVCAYSPRALWDAIVRAANRGAKSPQTLSQVHAAAVDDFPHFQTFIDHVRTHRSGVRILLLEDFRIWLPQPGQDNSRRTLPEHWKLFLLLNGYDENCEGQGVPFWGVDRESLLRLRQRNRGYRFLTDYVFLGRDFLLDYYDEAGILVASEGDRNSTKSYFMDLYELFVAKRETNSPFKTRQELHQTAVDAFQRMTFDS